MDEQQKIATLFKKYLDGRCSREEVDLFFRQIKTPQGRQILNELLDKEAVEQFYKEMRPTPEISERILGRLRNQIGQAPESRGRRTLSVLTAPVTRRIAATVTGMLLISIALLVYFLKKDFLEHKTAFGEITTVWLPDSSAVTLNANSSLRHASRWKPGESREVWIKGEAFFSVKHTAEHQKFTVHAQNAAIEVLGTTFNVNNRHQQVAVVLNTGKIRLKRTSGDIKAPEDKQFVMNPGDFVAISNDNGKVARKKVDPEQYCSWTKRKLIFDDTPVADIIQSLEDHFGMNIIVEDKTIQQHRYSGTIPLDDVDIFFQTLSKTLGMVIVEKADGYIIKKEENNPGSKDATP